MVVFGAIAPHGDPAFVGESAARVALEDLARGVEPATPAVTGVLTPHNVHGEGAGRQFNYSQPLPNMKNTTTFSTPDVMVRFKCNVHGWMEAYVGVLPHPYFAVTANGGAFELEDVPPGTYTIEAWHEKLGTQTQSVTIAPKEAKTIAFTFKAATP